MELTEVVSTQVALPVIGVLLCAVLVFAFGFRSPVQPPSFDFTDDKKNQKKNKKNKAKGQTNGHAVTVKEEAPAVKTQSPKSTKTTTNNKPKSPTTEKKVKKIEKVTPKLTSTRQKPQPSEVVDNNGGWSVAVSKKREKVRSKKEAEYVETKLTLEDIGFEKPVVVEDVPQEPPQEQRATKKKRQSKKSEGEVAVEAEAEPTAEPVAEIPTPAEPEPEPEPTPVPVVKETKPVVDEQKSPTTTNKKSKGLADSKQSTDKEKTDTQSTKDNTPPSPNKNRKTKGKKLSADAEEFQPITYDTKPKVQASPKKSGAQKNISEESAKKTVIKKEEKFTEVKAPIKKEKVDKAPIPVKEKTEVLAKAAVPAKAVVPAESKKAAESKEPVVFDELAGKPASWQEAPKIKKKKARREN